MKTEEQFHVEFLQEKAASLGLSFADYMLFLMFETLEHSPALNPDQNTGGFEPEWAQQYRQQMAGENPIEEQAQNEADGM